MEKSLRNSRANNIPKQNKKVVSPESSNEMESKTRNQGPTHPSIRPSVHLDESHERRRGGAQEYSHFLDFDLDLELEIPS
jgi:hypothetical protein